MIFDKSGQLVKELTFADALLVISMAIIPDAEELWVVSRFKIINKFKLDGTPIKRVSLPFPCANLIPVGQQNFLVYSGGTCNSRGSIEGHFLALTDFKSINKLFLPKWGKEEWPSAPQNIYAQDEKANNLFIFPNDIDTIYSYNQQKGDRLSLPFSRFPRRFPNKRQTSIRSWRRSGNVGNHHKAKVHLFSL
ncbi:MAG: hypothetical protein V8T12_08095 [Parabacteroides johnsonii]